MYFYIQVGEFKGRKVSLHHTGFTLPNYARRNVAGFHGSALSVKRQISLKCNDTAQQNVENSARFTEADGLTTELSFRSAPQN
jgi:hypothetical protein